jgi:DNA replication factor GINS
MDIDELLLILEKSKKDKIQKIDEDFYSKINLRLRELEERKKEIGDYQEAIRVDDELRTLRRIQRRIFEIRTSKILRAAWSEVCKTDSGLEGFENLIEDEKNLFRSLIESITAFKNRAFSSEIAKKEVVEKSEPDYVLVKVKNDADEFEGVNGKTYKLRREDVVTLPSLNAKILIKSGTVEVIDTGNIENN